MLKRIIRIIGLKLKKAKSKPKPKTRKKSGQFLKLLLLYSLIFVSAYTIFCAVVWAYTGIEPPTQLSIGVYGFFGTELFMGTLIRLTKPLIEGQNSGDYAAGDEIHG